MLLVTASQMTHAFSLPQGLDVITIPAVVRCEGSCAKFRSLRLPLPFEAVSHLRRRVIRETALAYSPELVLVDYRPAGVAGELISALRALKNRNAKLVLLLRDILDAPTIVRTKWTADLASLALPLYDEIWVYGCRNHHDIIQVHDFPEPIANKIRFCGYLDIEIPIAANEETRRALGVTAVPIVLVTIGNGLVGFPVLDAFLQALWCLPGGLSLFSVIVAGPELAAKDYSALENQSRILVNHKPRLGIRLTRFSPRLLDYMAAADLVISLGGYNTVTEILKLGKRSLVVPFYSSSNKEQLIRASLMDRFGLVRMIQSDQLSPERFAKTIMTALQDSPPTRQRLTELEFDFGGLQRIQSHVIRLLKSHA
jgi:predicted glycosyltransferase